MSKPQQAHPNGKATHEPPKRINDPRFANLNDDPRFRLPSQKKNRIALDDRFAPMLRDERFSSKAKVDRYGRKVPTEKSGRNQELERFYKTGKNLDSSKQTQQESESASEEEDQESSSEDDATSSSEDEASVDEDEEEEVFGILQQEDGQGADQIPNGEVSRRLAVVNLDWDNVRATDLMAVLRSFVPSGLGKIEKVIIFPSEFGKVRMQREELEGPPQEIFNKKRQSSNQTESETSGEDEEFDRLEGSAEEDENRLDASEEDEGDEHIKRSIIKEDAGQEFNSAHLRRYQLERLRYYYAVVTCTSANVAQAIYEAVDGTEYLSTANFFDLRYVPDGIDFSDDKPRDECKQVPDSYKPTEFVTDALQHSKVRLTWDADDTERKEAQKRAFKGGRKNVDENDLKAYLGSDSSEDEAPEPSVVDTTGDVPAAALNGVEADESEQPKVSKKEVERRKMRVLLGLPSESAPRKANDSPVVGDMQVTFTSGLSSDKQGHVFENTPEEAQETTVERYVRKEKERKARRKEKMQAKRTGDEVSESDDGQDAGAVEVKVAPEENAKDEDLGFDDPFFTADDTKPSKAELRASKKPKQHRKDAAQSSPPTSIAKTIDEDEANHFDIHALSRAQKLQSKAKSLKKRKHLSEKDKAALAMAQTDKFKLDVADPRFKDIYERPEYAVDPSHPRYLGTEGMKDVLEKAREKRAKEDTDAGDSRDPNEESVDLQNDARVGKSGKRAREDQSRKDTNGVGEVERLIKRVKGRPAR